jgi:hypothetical protein
MLLPPLRHSCFSTAADCRATAAVSGCGTPHPFRGVLLLPLPQGAALTHLGLTQATYFRASPLARWPAMPLCKVPYCLRHQFWHWLRSFFGFLFPVSGGDERLFVAVLILALLGFEHAICKPRLENGADLFAVGLIVQARPTTSATASPIQLPARLSLR